MIHGKEMVATGNNNNSSLDVSVCVRLIDLPLVFGGGGGRRVLRVISDRWCTHDH